MNSSKGNYSNAGAYHTSNKGKSTSGSSDCGVDQLSHNVSGMNLNSGQDEGWEEVYSKKTKNRSGNNFSKQRGPQNSNVRAWGHSDIAQKHATRSYGGSSARSTGQTWPAVPSETRKYVGRAHGKPQPSDRSIDSSYTATPGIPPPLENGWRWASGAAASQPSQENIGHEAQGVYPLGNQSSKVEVDDADEESEGFDETDEELLSDDYDSDQSQKSHGTKKRNNWFKQLFQRLDGLSVDEINDPEMPWHCPVCKGGPGAIDLYRGLQPVITHAKTKMSKRVKLHRELAELLEEELRRRGTSALPAGEAFGKWKGLGEPEDNEIVWPPMVMIMNTRLGRGDDDKWKGMGNRELVDYFREYSAVRARHSYGPQGHRGISVLIFEETAVGYVEAERLSKQFEAKGRNRLAWERNKVPFSSGGERLLYGFMAEKHDVEHFNQHSQGKSQDSKLMYEMQSYREMVVKQLKQMSEDNQLLTFYKDKDGKQQKTIKALQDLIRVLGEKHQKAVEEADILKRRTNKHNKATKEQMDSLELFLTEQNEQFSSSTNKEEEKFEEELQSEREKVRKQSQASVSSVEETQRKFFKESSEEERQHAEKLMEYQVLSTEKLLY